MGELSHEGEAEWRRLSRQIELAEGFWLGFVFSDDDQARAVLHQRVRARLEQGGEELLDVCPSDPAGLLEAVSTLFSDRARTAGGVWLEADAWCESWGWLALRLNERREALQRWLQRGLIIATTPTVAPVIRDGASDLWAIRALVLAIERRVSDDFRCRSNLKDVGAIHEALESFRQVDESKLPSVEVARVDGPLLVEGPVGAGKRDAARLVHGSSRRRLNPCVVVDAFGLTRRTVLGHERGAFLGALRPQKGLVELANRGTLVLHEIGGLPLDVQEAIVQVLDKHEVTRLGATRATPVDVRIIATTSRDLEEMCREGFFRQDLLHRLSLTRIELPAEAGPASDPH